jgi:murein L,D-transpeptidase YafK
MLFKVICSVFLAVLSFSLLLPPNVLSNIGRNLEKIPDSIVSVSSGYVIAVDKRRQMLYVFKKGSGFYKVFETNCSTGKNQGSKQVSGDAKTPTGIFFPTKILMNPGPPETYGTLAFPLDYPTMTDKKSGRNGDNIWIHGTSKPIAPFQSSGCVVLNDKDIHALAKYIYLNKTPVIIAETISWIPQNQTLPVKSELERVLASWTKAYLTGNINAIDMLYLRNYQLKGKKREQLFSQLSNIKNINQHFILEPKDVSILRQNNEAVIIFDQITDIKKDNSFTGSFNKLALQKISNRWFIIDDGTMQTPEQNINRQTTAIRPDTDPSSKEAIQKLISLWAKSWQSGNMSAYRACYMPDFRAQGKSLNAWVNHKINVRENSKNINIRIANLRISGNDNQATAIFTQHYSSNLLKSQGVKKLALRKMNGKWKIYQETMQ